MKLVALANRWCVRALRVEATSAQHVQQSGQWFGCLSWPTKSEYPYCRVEARILLTIQRVGARGVVHMPQFNGKQEGRVARSTKPHLRCPRNGQADELHSSVSVNMPLVALNKRLGRRQRSSPPARIPANKVAVRLKRAA